MGPNTGQLSKQRPTIDLEILDMQTKNYIERLIDDLDILNRQSEEHMKQRMAAEEFAFELVDVLKVNKVETGIYSDFRRAKTQVLLHIGRMMEKIDRR